MKKTFIYQDDKSNKFWTIETNSAGFTVTYGKTGTAGQTSSKSFDNEEKCLKEAEKLIAEKTKKGYVEGENNTVKEDSVERKKYKNSTPVSAEDAAPWNGTPCFAAPLDEVREEILSGKYFKNIKKSFLESMLDDADFYYEEPGDIKVLVVDGNANINGPDLSEETWDIYNSQYSMILVRGDLTISKTALLATGMMDRPTPFMVLGNLVADQIKNFETDLVVNGNIVVKGLLAGTAYHGAVISNGKLDVKYWIEADLYIEAGGKQVEVDDIDMERLKPVYIIKDEDDSDDNQYNIDEIAAALDAGKNIFEAENNDTKVVNAARNGKVKEVIALSKQGFNVNGLDKSKNTALYYIAYYYDAKTAKVLLEAGADPNLGELKPIIAAAENKNAPVLKLLIRHGADLNVGNSYNATALSLACRYHRQEEALLLIEAGADLNKKDDYKQTPLQLASESGSEKVVKILLEKGCPVNEQTNDGETAIQWASEHGHEEIVKMLLEYGADPAIKNKHGKDAFKLANSPKIKMILKS